MEQEILKQLHELTELVQKLDQDIRDITQQLLLRDEVQQAALIDLQKQVVVLAGLQADKQDYQAGRDRWAM
jgi:hypothetical protein